MKDTDAKVHLAFGELILGDRSLKDLDSNLRADHGKFAFDLRATGGHEGTLQGAGHPGASPAMERSISK